MEDLGLMCQTALFAIIIETPNEEISFGGMVSISAREFQTCIYTYLCQLKLICCPRHFSFDLSIVHKLSLQSSYN